MKKGENTPGFSRADPNEVYIDLKQNEGKVDLNQHLEPHERDLARRRNSQIDVLYQRRVGNSEGKRNHAQTPTAKPAKDLSNFGEGVHQAQQ